MNISNSQSRSVQQILSEIQQRFPNASLKKPFLSPHTIMVPQGNFKFLLRYKKTHLQLDFIPPVLWVIGGMLLGFAGFTVVLSIIFQRPVISIGGAIPVIVGLLLVKMLFKSSKKEEFETFQSEVNVLVNASISSPALFI